jgi:hypothetical protein
MITNPLNIKGLQNGTSPTVKGFQCVVEISYQNSKSETFKINIVN